MRVIVCDDEHVLRDSLGKVLRKAGHEVETVGTGEEAVARVREEEYDAILCDLRLPGISGIEVLRNVLLINPGTAVIIMTAYSSVETAVEALRQGAFDYLVKPFLHEDLRKRLSRVDEIASLRRRNELMRKQLVRQWDAGPLVGESQAFRDTLERVQRVAVSDSTVLLTGESGTGKELIARTIHERSQRAEGPFAPINVAAVPDGLIDGQLFGHVRGAFTGAAKASPGLFVSAAEGTLFLDEIGELPLPLQAKLLRVCENQEVLPLGASRTRPTNVRIVTSTNRDLEQCVEDGQFRADLYYRLAVVTIQMPPLRNRREDIPLLCEHFLSRYNERLGSGPQAIDGPTMRQMLAYDWPGNVRQLKNVVERACIFCSKDVIGIDDLPMQITGQSPPQSGIINLRQATQAFEISHIEGVVRHNGGDKRAAAEALGIGLSSLYRKLDGRQ